GSLMGHDGVFAETARMLADAHGADRAFVVTNGSTGANEIALNAHTRLSGRRLFLVDRQCHHSIPAILTRNGLDWGYIPTARWDEVWEAPEPVSANEVEAALTHAPREVGCVVVTSPTYAGELAD